MKRFHQCTGGRLGMVQEQQMATPTFAYHATWLSKSVACLPLKHVTRPGMPSSYQNKQQMSIPVTPKPATPQIHLVHAQTQDKGRCLNVEWCLKWRQLQLQLPPLFIQCVNVRFTFSIYILACTHKASVLHQAFTRPSPPLAGVYTSNIGYHSNYTQSFYTQTWQNAATLFTELKWTCTQQQKYIRGQGQAWLSYVFA